jgi:hypothetical protein
MRRHADRLNGKSADTTNARNWADAPDVARALACRVETRLEPSLAPLENVGTSADAAGKSARATNARKSGSDAPQEAYAR